jgi:hypothetical protein
MKIKIADTFLDSVKNMIDRQQWYWKVLDFIRYDLPNGIKNIFFFWKVIWQYRSWDSSFQMRILARSLEPLAHTLEHYGNEIDGPRLKKVAKIKRAIEILNLQANTDYISLAEEKLSQEVNIEYGILGTLPEDEEPLEIKETNRKIFELANELEKKEWEELFSILKGQDHTAFIMLCDRAKTEGHASEDLWDQWYDGSGMKHWWD